MPGPSWPALGVTGLSRGPGEALCRVGAVPQLSSALGGGGGWCRADGIHPCLLGGPSWLSLRAPGLEKGQPAGGAACTAHVQGLLLCLHIHSHQNVLHIFN